MANGARPEHDLAARPARPRLAREFAELLGGTQKPAFMHDVVIVGSGYGGSVAAHALAGLVKADGTPVSVCVLERGNEYLPGEFPSRFEDMPGHLRRSSEDTGLITGNPQGLFDVRMGPDVIALVANGVGGGSLINAGVLLEPMLSDFVPGSEAHALVAALKEDGWYAQALKQLGGLSAGRENTIALHPHADKVVKTAALGTLGPRMKPPSLSVSMTDTPNDANVQLSGCDLCGDCMTGCNVGAKDSLDANLLDLAARAGAKIYSGASVLTIRQHPNTAEGDFWTLKVSHTDPMLQKRETGPARIKAHHVILAAGTLGSTEILLRSRTDDLVFSPRLGQGFSCNGDNLSAVYDMARPTQACADEDVPSCERFVGPTITGSVTLQTSAPATPTAPAQRSFQLQEFSIPGPMKRVFEELVTTAKAFNDLPLHDAHRHGDEPPGAPDPMAVDDAAMARTLVVGTIGHDDAEGVLYLPRPLPLLKQPPQEGSIGIRWVDARRGARLEGTHRVVGDAVAALRKDGEGTPSLVANPAWRLLPETLESLVSQPRGPVLTVHPLGGCRIGPRALQDGCAGVVDRHGRVYDFSRLSGRRAGDRPDGVFGTLAVLDGSIMPGSLGVNPSLTITATAMRAMQQLCQDWKFAAPAQPQPQPSSVVWARRRRRAADVPRPAGLPEPPAGRGTTEVQVVERLRGEVQLQVGGARRDCLVELTLAYQPLPIGRLMGPIQRQMNVDANDAASRMRIFDRKEWDAHHLKLETDEVRGRWTLFEGRLCGTLAVLGREPSAPWRRILRALPAWFVNRGLRDGIQRYITDRPAPSRGASESIGNYLISLLRMGTRAGEVRRLDYDLQVAEVLPVRDRCSQVDVSDLRIGRGDVVRGSKRLTYGCRANPWNQLTRLSIEAMPAMRTWRWHKPWSWQAPVLELDGRFLAGQGFPLLRITRQRNSAVALADLASFGLYMTRLLVNIHLWTFRKPDSQPRRRPDRLPGAVAGLVEPEITELVVDHYPGSNKAITIRLTRYRQRIASRQTPGRPLVMIHGYSASGNTFTHASLPTSAAAYFCERGRDVWVVDLRTSAGLPSSTYPWSMEQVGLIDMPAALLHIRSVTNQPVDVLAHCIGCVMLSMALLTDASEVHNNKIELGADTWLTDFHLGQLKAFNNQVPGQPHPVIRKLILSQKGPVLRYTDNNILRAFLLQSMRRWLMRDDYQFQPGDDPGVMEELMDRLLASIPYPDADYDIENPFLFPVRVPWVATRHRMDALYGRAFDATNMAPATLAAINDIFGPINLETVSQTIHFARVNAITNQAGRGEFVTRDRLHSRWGGIDTYAIHGENNGLVDVLTQTLLSEHLRSAGVPFSEPSQGVRETLYAYLGHQDVLMGKTSRAVFDDLQRFLERGPPDAGGDACDAGLRQQPTPELVAALPWSGPRLVPPPQGNGRVEIACLSDPTQGEGRLFLVPAARWTGADGERRHRLIGDVDCVHCSERGSSADWMFVEPDADRLGVHCVTTGATGEAGQVVLGWLAVVVYPAGETTARRSPLPMSSSIDDLRVAADAAQPEPAPNGPARRQEPAGGLVIDPAVFSTPTRLSLLVSTRHVDRFAGLLQPAAGAPAADTETQAAWAAGTPVDREHALVAVQFWLKHQRSEDIELAFVELANVNAAQAMAERKVPDPTFAFALGSCQYVTGLVDAQMGQASLDRLARCIDTTEQRVGLALFVGDQIYADATAGLIDPTRRDELYAQPNDKAMRALGMRAVLRRVPAHMLLDDHELKDNWEPLPPQVALYRVDADRSNNLSLKRGAQAWSKFQRMEPLGQGEACVGLADFSFMAGGLPFWFADTRTGRSARGSTMRPQDRRILNKQQWQHLRGWLLDHRDQVKFIATPSILLPRRRTTVAGEGGSDHSDAWDGFPASMDELFAFIVEHQITNTVFLSGDEHCAMVAEAVITSRSMPLQPAVKIVSVHSSGLYAPYPFANGHPDEMAQDDSFSLPSVQVAACTRFAPLGDGFARLQVRTDASVPMLDIEWIKAGGNTFAVAVALR